MRKIILRMLREIKNHKGQFFSIVIIIAIGSAMFSGMLGAILSIQNGIDHYYANQNLADLWVGVQGATKEEVRSLQEEYGFEAEGRYSLNMNAIVSEQEVSLRAHSMTDINEVFLKEGELPKNTQECVVDSKFAKANSLHVGDFIEDAVMEGDVADENIITEGQRLLITGIGDSPEYAYKVKDNASAMVSPKTFGIVFCTENTMEELIKQSEAYKSQLQKINDTLKGEDRIEKAVTELDDSFLTYQELLIKSNDIGTAISAIENQDYYRYYLEREDQASYSMVSGGVDTISTISYIFPVVFFVVAALILLICMTKMVENQRMQIAVMEAMGISKGNIRMGFIFYAAMASLAGSVLFSYLGNLFLPHVLIKMFRNRFAIHGITALTNPIILAAPFVLAFLLSALAAGIAVSEVLSLVPAQAMRPKPPKKSKRILLERIPGLWRRMSYPMKLICRNLFLNKMRVLLSSIGIICSVMLMLTGLSLQNAANDVLVNKQDSVGYDLSVVYYENIASVSELNYPAEVESIELTKNIKGSLSDFEHQTVSVQLLPVGCELIRIFDETKQELPIENNSVILPQTLAEDCNIAVQDTIAIQINENEFVLTVTGISVQYTSNILYISENMADAVGIDTDSNVAMVKLKNVDDATKLKDDIYHDEKIKAVNLKSEVSGAVADNLKMMNTIIDIIVVAAIIMSVAVIYNITSINLFERSREYATLMVLGYYKKEVNHLLFRENMVITVLGCIGGLPCGIILFRVILNLFNDSGVTLPQKTSSHMVLIAYAITIIFAIITNIIMKKKIKEIDMIEALKGVE